MLRRLLDDAALRYCLTIFRLARVSLSLFGIVLWQLNLVPKTIEAFHWIAFVFTLLRTVAEHPLADEIRYCLTFFPAFIALALQTENNWRHRFVMYPSMTAWLALSGIYIMGGFVG